jgi:chemotaxis protein methyltransferase CheR
MGYFAFKKVKIFASDIDNTSENFGNIIRNARYNGETIKRIPPEILSKYFTPINDGVEYQLVSEIKEAIEFQKHDLLSYQEIRSAMNVIMCKNVLLHFHEDQRVEVIKMFAHALVEKRFLIMERTQEMPKETAHLFEQVTTMGQVFRKK